MEEFQAGHVAEAVNVPVMLKGPGGGMEPNPDFVEQVRCTRGTGWLVKWHPPVLLNCPSVPTSSYAANESLILQTCSAFSSHPSGMHFPPISVD